MFEISTHLYLICLSPLNMNISHITGLNQLLSENRIQDLMLMYQLFSRVRDGLKELATAFASYIKVSVGTFIFNTGPKGHLKYCHFTFFLITGPNTGPKGHLKYLSLPFFYHWSKGPFETLSNSF